jgi:hypothetical protein
MPFDMMFVVFWGFLAFLTKQEQAQVDEADRTGKFPAGSWRNPFPPYDKAASPTALWRAKQNMRFTRFVAVLAVLAHMGFLVLRLIFDF